MNDERSAERSYKRHFHISLRAALALMLVVAVYGAGWASHGWYSQRNDKLPGPVTVQYVESLDIIELGGTRDDVRRLTQLIEELRKYDLDVIKVNEDLNKKERDDMKKFIEEFREKTQGTTDKKID
ncbi:hypothetical protein NG895_09980 [Aeoliella sp. ICT_H6.2]|uniref:Uncharacterized protein n=1 Tax=Aeoliella straminimaris TaxID=2954799 RepID=A0A9X2JIR8_9BACT|nr:hypothetical protein [Aeoliella straminimaris]MCO6044234.1 hypothetical protein [Aeoliella straminimaris]